MSFKIVQSKKNEKNLDFNKTKHKDDNAGLVKIVKDIGVIGISKILLSIGGLILLPVLTKYIGAFGYGLWANVNVTIGLILPALLLGLNSAVVRIFPSKTEQDRRNDLSMILLIVSSITVIFSILLYIFPGFLAGLFFDGEIFVVRFLAIILFVWCLDNIFLSTFQAFREMKKYALVKVVAKYSEIGLAVILVIRGYGLFGALASVLLVRSLLLIILLSYFSKNLGISTTSLKGIKNIKEYFHYGIPIIPSSLAYWVISASDRYLISFFMGVTYVGYYSPGYTIGKFLPFMLGGIIFFVLKPSLSVIYDEGKIEEVKKTSSLLLKYTLLLVIPFIFGIILFHYEITALLSTSEIARNGSIIAIFTAFTGLVYVFYRFTTLTLVLLKKTKFIGSIKTIGALVNILGNIILIPIIGIIGAAITTLVAYLLITASQFLLTRTHIPFAIDIENTLKIVGSSLVMFFLLFMIKTHIHFLYLVPFGVLIYFGVLLGIRGISKREFNYMKRLIGS